MGNRPINFVGQGAGVANSPGGVTRLCVLKTHNSYELLERTDEESDEKERWQTCIPIEHFIVDKSLKV